MSSSGFGTPEGQPPILYAEPESYRTGPADFLLGVASGMRGQLDAQAAELADHGGQLKLIPALAAAVQSNFAVWLSVIAIVATVFIGGFAFLGAYQVSNSQKLDEHSAALREQGVRLEHVDSAMQVMSAKLNDIGQSVAILADRAAPSRPHSSKVNTN